MTQYVELLYDNDSYTTREPYSNDSWDRGDTATTWHFKGAKLVEDHAYRAVPYEGELKRGDTVWCVFAVYSTGDSFGHDHSGSMEFIAVHKTAEAAYETARRHEDTVEEYWVTDQGTEVQIGWRPWNGYFESLEKMYVEPYTLR